jgi:hypothetical protein
MRRGRDVGHDPSSIIQVKQKVGIAIFIELKEW